MAINDEEQLGGEDYLPPMSRATSGCLLVLLFIAAGLIGYGLNVIPFW